MSGGGDLVLAGVGVHAQVDGGHEPLSAAVAHEVVVAVGEEVPRGHRADQSAEGAGQHQGAGTGVHPLARDVHHRDVQPVAAEYGHDEVAAEGGAAGLTQDGGASPALGELRQPALVAQPVAQVQQHHLAAQPLDAEAFAHPGQQVGQDGGDPDGDQQAGAHLADVEAGGDEEQDRGDHGEQEGQALAFEEQSAGQDGEDGGARREPAGRPPHGAHADADGQGDQGDQDEPVAEEHLALEHRDESLRGGAQHTGGLGGRCGVH